MLVTLASEKKKTFLHCGGLTLKPGPNQVDAKLWAQIRKHPSMQKRIEAGTILEEMDAEEAAKLPPDADKEQDFEALKGMKDAQAKRLVEDTVDLDLLNGWMKREKRPKLKEFIKKHIAKIEEPGELRDRTKSRQLATGSMQPDVMTVDGKPSAQDD